MVAGVDGAQTPESEAESAVGIETQGNMSRRVELALKFHGPAEGSGGGMRHFYSWKKKRVGGSQS